MKSGKLTTEQLKKLVFSTIKKNRKEVLVRPEIGEDCAVLDFGENVCVVSTDPITGASDNIGKLAIDITCNDIAASGALPMALLLTIMVPVGTKEEEIKKIMEDASFQAEKLNVDIVGGHTEVTPAVNRIIVSSTGIGMEKKETFFDRPTLKEGDSFYITKGSAIEGTAILAWDFEEKLKKVLNEEEILEAKSYIEKISVVKEGLIGFENGATIMHDVTEGGILGALWEVCDLIGRGADIYEENMGISSVSQKICDYFELNPLRLISSGTMLFAVSKEVEEKLVESIKKEGIEIYKIGMLRNDKEMNMLKMDGTKEVIEPPLSDELYKVLQ